MADEDDTLRMLEDAARGFASFDAKRLRDMRDQVPGFDRDVYRKMGEQGWFSILVSEDNGGLGLGIDAATTIARQLGHACTMEPFVAAGVVIPTLLDQIGVEQCDPDFVSAILSGEHLACLAWQNANGSPDPAETDVTARSKSDGYTLSGVCRFVPVAHADTFIVAARIDDGLGLFRVPGSDGGTPDQDHVQREFEATADGGFSAQLTFNNFPVAKAACLATGERAAAALRTAIDNGILANCAELLGNMDRSLELTLDYLKTRKQFGQAIGSFQVLQHRAVDLWMKKKVTEFALNASIKRASAPMTSADNRTRAASSAKYRAAKEAHAIANEAIQLHGAIGFTDEYDLGLYVNRALTLVPFLGNADEHRRQISALQHATGAEA